MCMGILRFLRYLFLGPADADGIVGELCVAGCRLPSLGCIPEVGFGLLFSES